MVEYLPIERNNIIEKIKSLFFEVSQCMEDSQILSFMASNVTTREASDKRLIQTHM
jgi:hypothetical protein